MHKILDLIGIVVSICSLVALVISFIEPNIYAMAASFSSFIAGLLLISVGKILFTLGEIRNALVAGFELQVDK